jgi:hypothetical protein
LQRLILRQGVEQLLHRLALLLQQLPGNVEGREATGTQTNIQCQWLNMIYMIYIYDIYIYMIYIYDIYIYYIIIYIGVFKLAITVYVYIYNIVEMIGHIISLLYSYICIILMYMI